MTLRITTLEKENSNLDHQVHDLQKECNALTEEIEKHKAEYADLEVEKNSLDKNMMAVESQSELLKQ